MKILNAEQIRDWDQYTMKHEPISSIDLMERAAGSCFAWLENNGYLVNSFSVFCGKGNNGGDGLALARMLAERNCKVSVFILEFGHKGTEDFQINLARLHQYPAVEIHFIQDESNFHSFTGNEVIIDALFGSGLTRPLAGLTAQLVQHINLSGCEIVSIDVPSGLSIDQSSKGNPVIHANHTLSFQCYKLAFLLPENKEATGDVHIFDIGLLPEYLNNIETRFNILEPYLIRSLFKKRNRFSHKGDFGHALLIAGSYGKMGAAVLSARACMRSGAGLLTCFVPACGYNIMQTSVPEAMLMTDINSSMITKPDIDYPKYHTIGIGPGLGTASETRKALKELFSSYNKPMVIDADALNSLAMGKKPYKVPPGSVLTPHPKEFDRLFGECTNDLDRIEKSLTMAKTLDCLIVLKGHHTFIATQIGNGYFNSTGNAGMATGGSGDVLTGIITGLLAQGYTGEHAAILGVYLHGMAGDIAAGKLSEEAMIAGDIIENMGEAFKSI